MYVLIRNAIIEDISFSDIILTKAEQPAAVFGLEASTEEGNTD